MRKTNFKTKISFCIAFFLLVISFPFSAWATTYPINVTFSGAQEVPANASTGTGTFVGTYNDSTNTLTYTINFSGLLTNTTAAHFHAPAPPGIAAGVIIAATGFPTGVTSGTYNNSHVLTAGQEDTLKMGLWYFNIHTSGLPGGEIRAQIFLQDASFVLPAITCPADTTVSTSLGQCTRSVTFAATTTAGTPAPVLSYRIGGTAITSPYVFPKGITTVTATALNAAGFATCNFKVTVNDTEPPSITCPANIVRSNDPGQCGAIVNFSATATDNCPGVTITYNHASGSFFPVGSTTVTATATDASNNKSTCSFTVTVNDTEPPSIHDLGVNPPIIWPPNHKMKNVTVNYTSTDNCPGPITCNIAVTSNEPENGLGDGDTAPDWDVLDDHHVKLRAERSGTGSGRVYTITVSCTDQYGNTGTGIITDTVPRNLSLKRIRQLVFQFSNPGHGHRTAIMQNDINATLPASTSKSIIVMNEADPDNISIIRVYPNPSRNDFTVNIETANNNDKVSVRLIDMSGRVVETKNNLSGSQSFRIGKNLKAGLYFAEIRQGSESKLIKLVKLE